MNNGKVRIYELSKELELDNKDILAVCERLEIAVKSHSSTISEEEAERIRSKALEIFPSTRSATHKSDDAAKRPHRSRNGVKKQQILEVRSHHPSSSDDPASQSDATLVKPPTRPVPSSTTPRPAPSAPPTTATVPTAAPPESVTPSAPLESVTPPAPSPSPDAGSTADLDVGSDLNGNGTAPEGNPVLQGPPQRKAAATALKPPSPPKAPDAAAPSDPEAPQGDGPPKGQKRAKSKTKTGTVKDGAAAKDGASGDGKDGASRAAKAATPPGDRPMLRPKPAIAPAAAPKAPQAPPASPASAPAAEVPKAGPPLEIVSPPSKPTKAKPSKPVRRGPEGKDGPREGRGEKVRGDGPPAEKKPAKPQVMELRRPKPLRTPETPPQAIPPNAPEEDDTDGIELEKEPEVLELQRPRRSIEPPRAARKGKTWENEEEEDAENKRKAAKTGTKTKRRPHIIDEDDDDLVDDLDLENDGDNTLNSLSLMRPPKPRSNTPVSKPAPTPNRKSKSDSGRDTRQRRERQVAPTRQRPETLILAGGVTVQQLAEMLVVPETQIISTLFMKGIAATITQTLDLPTIELLAQEMEVTIERPEATSEARKTTEVLDASDLDNLHRRPPVVTVMGHVDHGKTTLLDSIRKTKVAQGEAGGITQHIGAYHVDVEHGGKTQQVVFLDTPGHEAFTAMRARGARVTDIAILVVAADDGVRPQTIEAISHAKAAEVPIIVAINKIDKEDANPDRVKQELMEYGLVPEEWGGEAIMVPVSAIKGENLDTLLEMILLVSEVEELAANPDRAAKGTIVEAHLDKARGPVATLLVQNGTLKVGDVLVAGSVFGKVRAMIDDRGNRVDSAGPSVPVEVLGLSNVPAAGHEFDVFLDEKEARSVSIERAAAQRTSRLQQAMASRRVTLTSVSAQAQEGELKELNLLLKSDVQGSLEAILGSLEQLPQKEVQLRTLLAAPGEITETDVDLAAASGAVILGFNTTLASGAKRAADEAGVDVREYDIIYKLLEDVQGAMEGLLEPEMVEEPLGQAEVRAIFTIGRGAVAGCYVQSGKLVRNCTVRIHRGNTVVYSGNLDSLRRVKDDVKEVNSGYECGVSLDSFSAWQEGDVIEAFRMATKRRTLSA
ncbi:MAG: translation initiation factor IF-2 [Prochlorothrix sp.]